MRGRINDGSDDFESWIDKAVDASELGERPDIHDYLFDFDPEWQELFDHLPNDMSDGAIHAMIDFLWDVPVDEWDWDEYENFWDWFEAHYNEN